jgi:hypothetical protein
MNDSSDPGGEVGKMVKSLADGELADIRRRGTTRLQGRPLDDDGAIELTRIQDKSPEFTQSFDGREWARGFAATMKETGVTFHSPHVFGPMSDDEIESLMLGWFRNAIMRGHDEAKRSAGDVFNASEALFAFVGWLSVRDENVTIGKGNDCAPLVPLIGQFIDKYKLSDLRDGWENNIVADPINDL